MDMDIIRKAIIKNRGGFEKASDGQIMIIWNSLDETTQQKYLQSVSPKGASKERKGKDAVSDTSKRNV